jgi:hypothetical protein
MLPRKRLRELRGFGDAPLRPLAALRRDRAVRERG